MKISKNKFDLLLAKNCITVLEVAEQCGVSRNIFLRINKGLEMLPRTVGKIAKALNCDVTELLED